MRVQLRCGLEREFERVAKPFPGPEGAGAAEIKFV